MSSFRTTVLAVLAFALNSGCAAVLAESGRLQPEQYDDWREITTQHFRLRTNLASADARAAGLELEKLRSAVLSGLAAVDGPSGRFDVILFRDWTQFRAVGANALGYVIRDVGSPVMVAVREGFRQSSDNESVYAHELAHCLSLRQWPRQPRWLAEGLAGYLGTVSPSSERSDWELGAPPAGYLSLVRFGPKFTVEELWTDWEGLRPEPLIERYASAWLYVHYLANAEPERWMAFRQRLATSRDSRRAWTDVFGEGTAQQVKRAASDYALQILPRKTVAVSLPAVELDERPLGRADVHAVMATFWLKAPGSLDRGERERRANAELQESLRLEPTNLAAVRDATMRGSREERIRMIREFVRAHPDEPAGWALLLFWHSGGSEFGPERDQAFEKLRAYRPTESWMVTPLALELSVRRKGEDALGVLSGPLEESPWDPLLLFAQSVAFASLGRCEEMREGMDRLLALTSDNAPAGAANPFAEQRQTLSAACEQQRLIPPRP